MGDRISLTRRLRAAADLVRYGSVAADVGCDHGKLSAYLLDSGRAEFVYATDIRKQPLAKAAALLSSERYEGRYECVLTDGLNGLPADRITDVVIAGVGDDVTEKIIGDAPWLKEKGKRLVLVPASRHERVRQFLAENGFSVIYEQAVSERRHVYTVIAAEYTGDVRSPDIREKWLGRIDMNTDDGREYIAVLKRRMEAVAGGIRDSEDPVYREAVSVLEEIEALDRGAEEQT
ncbi:MAG: SAM-dependent methyltransferase [Oscillospiraceae bacterium]|nr:SAM-dependent methyltransferase [Oscillospiraceae bacterium]